MKDVGKVAGTKAQETSCCVHNSADVVQILPRHTDCIYCCVNKSIASWMESTIYFPLTDATNGSIPPTCRTPQLSWCFVTKPGLLCCEPFTASSIGHRRNYYEKLFWWTMRQMRVSVRIDVLARCLCFLGLLYCVIASLFTFMYIHC